MAYRLGTVPAFLPAMSTKKHTWLELGPKARVMQGPEPWLEGEALRQLEDAAALPDCERVVGLPDLHPGPGIPIGVTISLRGVVRPGLVGSDAGCGARVTAVGRVKHRADALDRRVRAATDDPLLPDIDESRLLEVAWHQGPRGLCDLDGIPEDLAEWAATEPLEDPHGPLVPSGPTPADTTLAHDLATVGGGNHFLELSRVVDIVDRAAADKLGLTRGGYAVVAHSGSRRVGFELAEEWGSRVLDDEAERASYLALHAGALRFARTNRFLLTWRMLTAAGMARASRVKGSFDVTHNAAMPSPHFQNDQCWLHRKGSAPAGKEQATVVLATRGDASWVLKGTGSEEALWSVAHGAGRRWSRADALEQVRKRYKRHELHRTEHGGRVICDDAKLLCSEHPDAYKPIEPVIQAIEQAAAATRVASLVPVVTVKR